MERLYQRAAAEHRRTRIPELRQTPYDDPLPSDTTTARLNVEGITDELKKSFWTIYKKHGSLKERRDFKTVVNNVSREASLARYELQPFNVENALRISEQQYKVLLAWYKKTVEDDLLRPLRETLHLEVTKVELSSPSSSDEMESPNPDRFLNQDIPLRGPGVVISQAYMNESASHELDGVPVHLDNRNTSGNRTRLPPPSKLASNPYPIHMCSLLILLATKSSSGNEKTLRISSQPISPPDCLPAASALYRVPSSNCRDLEDDSSDCSTACNVPEAQPYGFFLYHQSPPWYHLPAASALYRVPSSNRGDPEDDSGSTACAVSEAQPYGNPGQLSSAVTCNRLNMHNHSAENVSSPTYSGGTSYYHKNNGQTSYGYHSQSGSSSESNFSRSQRFSPYPTLPEAKSSQSAAHSWSVNASNTGCYSSNHTGQGIRTEDYSPAQNFTHFEDTKTSPHSRSMSDGEAANGASEGYYGHQ
ncbi:hypothetical protein EV361DRAFT_872842 [Lentinula raphanica]|nr:hypothetical protein EV361DRAFT_872842 [Lentinula raphanica]